jgi:pimeloyl-ACP methyl ester carboxylesterase
MSKPSIVFCHGLWADGSCFNKVMGPLRAEGFEVIASEHGLDSLQDDVDCVLRAVGRVSSPVILVGHSYGGTLITAAGTDDRVVGLVYICALAPDESETSQSQQSKFPVTDVFSHIEIADDRIWLLRDGVDYFAGDLTDEEKELTWATAMAPVPICLNRRSTVSPGGRSRAGTSSARTTTPSTPISRAQPRSAWGHDIRVRDQSRPDTLPPRPRARRDPHRRERRTGIAHHGVARRDAKPVDGRRTARSTAVSRSRRTHRRR